MDKMDYKPKSILLTGGAGFIGSNVMVFLHQKYPQVKMVCYDKLDYCASEKNFAEIRSSPNFTFIKGDICDVDFVRHVIKAEKIDTILHFAAQTHVDNSFGNSFEFTKTNVLGTHVMLECAKNFQPQIRRFIHVSTDEVYGESQAEGKRKSEDCPMDPSNPYAATKGAAELMAKSYRTSFNLPIIITRGNNVYGPKQYPEKLIPKFISLLNRGKPCPLHGDGSNRRSFLYVSDVARAFDVVLHKGSEGMTYNIGNSHFEIENRQVLKILIELFGLVKDADKLTKFVRDRVFNDFRYHIDSKNLETLGWNREIDFAAGLRLTKEWYLARPDYWGDVSGALAAHPVADKTVHSSKVHGDGIVEPAVTDDEQAAKRPKK